MKRTALIIFIFSIVFSVTSIAQIKLDTFQTDQTVLIKMLNGEEYIGKIVQQDKEKVVLEMTNGELNLKNDQIVSVEAYEYKGKFGYDNPHATRYYFSPSGIPIRKGEGYYQNIMISSNFVNYGITKNVSIGGGFEFISLMLGNPIWFFSPKVGFNITEKLYGGAGVFMVGAEELGVATLAYGVITRGTTESNVTLGIAYGFADGERTKYPVVNFAATHRFRHNAAFLTENYFITSNDGETIYMGVQGVRIMSKKNAFDVGIIVSSEFDGALPALPYVGYARAF